MRHGRHVNESDRRFGPIRGLFKGYGFDKKKINPKLGTHKKNSIITGAYIDLRRLIS